MWVENWLVDPPATLFEKVLNPTPKGKIIFLLLSFREKFLFKYMKRTAESVTPKHPDKVCDRISDAILDECLRQDPNSRVAVEVMGGHGLIVVVGELTSKAKVDIKSIVERIVGDGYRIDINVSQQSLEIAQGVNQGGAGDQGIMIGYACNENEAYLPQEFYLARHLCQFIYNRYPEDGKTQITMKGEKIESVVASFNNVSQLQLERLVKEWGKIDKETNLYLNSAGDWSVGSFDADTGLTGRKIVVDAYGPRVPVGGGCFSGKDPSKVDRSGAYISRKIAKDILIQEKADSVRVELAYVFGLSCPASAQAFIEKKGVVTIQELEKENLTPSQIIKQLDLKQPIYEKVASWGSFGHSFIWG